MSDRKSNGRSKPYRRRFKRGSGTSRVPRVIGFNEMRLKTAWSHAALVSGTTGTLSDFISPTIQNSNEYSTVASLFTEVKLLGMVIHLIPKIPTLAASTATAASTLTVGTRYDVNMNTASVPTTLDQVINSSHVIDFSTASLRTLKYRMSVPRGLEFSVISQDAPNPGTPWAGSPGVVLFFGTGYIPSTNYFDVRVYASYHLRGRN